MNEGRWSYLPKHFWYDGMDKIKAGKGYRDGKPYGIIAGICKECEGQLIKMTMNTSAKGFETASETVCKECGLVIPGAYQVLDKKPDYKSIAPLIKDETKEEDLALRKYYNSKGEELYTQRQVSKDNKGKTLLIRDDISKPDGRPTIKSTYYTHENEYYYGTHKEWMKSCKPEGLPTSDLIDNDDTGIPIQHEPLEDILQWTDRNIQLGHAIHLNNPKHAVLYNRPKEEVKEYERLQHIRYAEAVASDMQMNKLQIDQVKYIFEKYPNIMMIDYSYEDIIYHICLYVAGLSLSKQRRGGLMYKYGSLYDYNKRLYKVIKEKLDKETI